MKNILHGLFIEAPRAILSFILAKPSLFAILIIIGLIYYLKIKL